MVGAGDELVDVREIDQQADHEDEQGDHTVLLPHRQGALARKGQLAGDSQDHGHHDSTSADVPRPTN